MIRGVEIIKIKKYEDKRGILLKILKKSQLEEKEFGEIYFTTLHQGIIRANHYHKKTTEWFCVLDGKGKLILKDNQTNETIELTIGNDKIVKIPINVSHAIKNIGNKEMLLLVYCDKEYNEENPDSVATNILKNEKNNNIYTSL